MGRQRMPNIQRKPFMHSGRTCYACGKEIRFGSTDWTYNTRHAGLFAHQTCVGQVQPKPIVPPMPAQQPKPIETPKSTPTVESVIQSAPIEPKALASDITDKIIIDNSKHNMTGIIKLRLRQRKYPFLYGAPGAGKTHLMESIAKDMGLNFCLISCSSDMFKSEILGSRSPITGDYFDTAFRQAWEHGGLILLDEVGLASGAFLNVMNAGLAQKSILFPDKKLVAMHSQCFIAFADNSALYGNDPMFPERQDAGGAFRDRITYVKFEYDLELERRILTIMFDGDTTRASKWHSAVLAMRQQLSALNIPVFASPRFAYASADDFKHGVSFDTIISQNLLKGINGDIEAQVKNITNAFRGAF